MTKKKLLLLLLLLSHSLIYCFPIKVENAIKIVGLRIGDIVFVMDHKECSSCINAELSAAINYYKNTSKNIFFLTENKLGYERLGIILSASGITIENNNSISNEVLFNYLKRKSRFYSFDGNKFRSLTTLPMRKNIFNNFANLSLNTVDSIPLPARKSSIAYDGIKIGSNLYFLSSDLGTISYLLNGEPKLIDLYSKLDTSVLLSLLNLNSSDYSQTNESFKVNKLIGDRFVEFKHFCPSNDPNSIYISLTVSSEHTYSFEEKQVMLEKSKLAKNALAKNINAVVTGSIHKPMVIQLNRNFEIQNYFLVDKSPENYFVDIYSNFYIDSNIIYANPIYNPDKFSSSFSKNNFLVEKLQIKNNKIIHTGFEEAIKSEWYNNPKRRIDFTGTSFQVVSNDVFLRTNTLPYWYNLSNETIFEIPLKQMEKLAKLEKNKNDKKNLPSFLNLGILKFNSETYIGFFRSPVTAKIYYAVFTNSGEFLNSYALDIDIRYNGIVQVLDNKLVRLKEKHMLIYELN